MHQRPSLVQIRAERDRFAASYVEASLLQAEVAERLIERLDYIRLKPSVILDLMAASGYGTQQLVQRYPDAHIYAVDDAKNLLVMQQAHDRLSLISMDLEKPALATASVDLIVLNLGLAYLADPQFCFRELNRILKPGGLFIFTSLGPDTLQELNYAFHGLDEYAHVWQFIDMHHLGDALLATGWEDPVMDMELLTLSYEKLEDLLSDLRVSGGRNQLAGRCPHLMPRGRWKKMQQRYAECSLDDGQLPASFEIIYGHAWKAQTNSKAQQNDQGEVLVPVDSIKRKGE